MTFRDRWSTFTAIPWVLGLGSGLALYGFLRLGTPAPLIWVIAIAGLSIPLLLERTFLESALRTGILPWTLTALVFTGASFLWSSQSTFAEEELLKRILSVAFIFVGAAIAHQPNGHRTAALAFGANVLLATSLNAVDVVAPLTFSEVFGRSAGFYGNPNVSGMAILCGTIIALPYLRQSQRAPLVGIAGIGILMTLSRGILLAYAVCVMTLVVTRRVSLGRTLIWAGGVAAAATLAALLSIGAEGLQLAYSAIAERGVLDRIIDASVTISGIDYSTNLRTEVLREGLRLFAENPFFGAGIGATNEWSLGASTHNIYVKQLAEYGLAGLALYAWLIVIALRLHWTTNNDGTNGVLLLALGLLGLFSHNLLDDWSILITWSLVLGSAAPLQPLRFASEDANALRNQHHEGERVHK